MRVSLSKLLMTASLGVVVACTPVITTDDAGPDDAGPEEELGCTETSGCEDDETCDVDTGECLCADVGSERTDGTVCQGDGSWELGCLDDLCLPEGQLCQYDTADAEYNQCVEAGDITGGCDEADGAEAVSGDDAIVVYWAETLSVVEDACGTNGDLPIRAYYVSIYSEEDLSAADAQDVLFRPGFTAGGEKFFEDADNESSLAALLDENDEAIENEYEAIVHICGNPTSAAIQVKTEDNTSNAYCFDPLAAAE
ncbi:MAG: hypothetical protein ACO3JL_14885 [Myxococcota bacterium]